MLSAKSIAATLLAVLLTGVACGGESEPLDPQPLGGPHGEHPFGGELVTVGTGLGEISGHLIAALSLYVEDEKEAALDHAKHPIEELETTIEAEVGENTIDVSAVATEVSDVIALIRSDAPVGEVAHAIDQVQMAVHRIIDSVIEDPVEEEEFRASLIIGVLETGTRLYKHAVVDAGEEVVLQTLYEDAFGFHDVARNLYSKIETEVIAASPPKAEEIEAAFNTIDHAAPSINPPENPVDVPKVESAAETIATLLEETIGALPPKERDPGEVIHEITVLLDDVLKVFQEGKTEAAVELAEETYLDEYLAVEAEIVEFASGVNDKLEPLLAAEIPKAILEELRAEELKSLIDEAKKLLSEARAAIPEG